MKATQDGESLGTVSLSEFRVSGRPFTPPSAEHAVRGELTGRSSAPQMAMAGRPTPDQFIAAVARELRRQFYQVKTVKAYRQALTEFLRWFGNWPHLVSRDDVQIYLEMLATGGANASWVSINLAAIRTGFDELCGRELTAGLVPPRPIDSSRRGLSPIEVRLLLSAAVCRRDKLLLGLLYFTGMTAEEVVRLRWSDLDETGRWVNVWQGGRRSARRVLLPECFEPLWRQLDQTPPPGELLLASLPAADALGKATLSNEAPSTEALSSETAELVIRETAEIAGIGKPVTSQALRVAWATQVVQHGVADGGSEAMLAEIDLQRTTIYAKVGRAQPASSTSQLDLFQWQPLPLGGAKPTTAEPQPVGRMKLELTLHADSPRPAADAAIVIHHEPDPVRLEGAVVRQSRPGWLALDLPLLDMWQHELSLLPPEQRKRLGSPAFFDRLRQHLGDRFLAVCRESKAAGETRSQSKACVGCQAADLVCAAFAIFGTIFA